MRVISRTVALAIALVGLTAAFGLRAQPRPTVVEWLDLYAAGRSDDVVNQLKTLRSFDEVLNQLRRDGPTWIAAQGPEAAMRREVVAATFALEAARAGSRVEWKFIQRQPVMSAETGESYQPPPVLYWKAPPLILEWACERWRARPIENPAERWWQLAAVAVGHYSEDDQFQVGHPIKDPSTINTQDEIVHLEHAIRRWPKEPRLSLAQVIAVEWRFPGESIPLFEALTRDSEVGPEARVRLGVALTRRGRHADAVKALRQAEQDTRDPHLVYLARLFRGQALEALRKPREAEAAYRAAVLTVPGAQSAVTALAGLLAAEGRRLEAQRFVAAASAVKPLPVDPWRVYVHGDDRYWHYLIGRLRQEIAR